MPSRSLTCLAFVVLAVSSGPAAAYELYLDIDQDNDPTTINDFTWDPVCTVRLVLAPTEPDEEIWSVDFGLGGSCVECMGVFAYGTGNDLGDMNTWTWETHPYFAGTWDAAYTPLLEMADPGSDPVRGGLLVARYGEGTYVYTGLSFFRAIPAGVPGAFKLLLNLLNLGAGEN